MAPDDPVKQIKKKKRFLFPVTVLRIVLKVASLFYLQVLIFPHEQFTRTFFITSTEVHYKRNINITLMAVIPAVSPLKIMTKEKN